MGTFVSKIQNKLQHRKGFFNLKFKKAHMDHMFRTELGTVTYTFGVYIYNDEQNTTRIAIDAYYDSLHSYGAAREITPPHVLNIAKPISLKKWSTIRRILKYDGGMTRLANFIVRYIDNYPVSL